MRYAIRSAVIRLVLLETALAALYVAVAYKASSEADTLHALIDTMQSHCEVLLGAQPIILIEAIIRFGRKRWGHNPGAGTSHCDDERSAIKYCDPGRPPEFNSNGYMMMTDSTDVTGRIRGDTQW